MFNYKELLTSALQLAELSLSSQALRDENTWEGFTFHPDCSVHSPKPVWIFPFHNNVPLVVYQMFSEMPSTLSFRSKNSSFLKLFAGLRCNVASKQDKTQVPVLRRSLWEHHEECKPLTVLKQSNSALKIKLCETENVSTPNNRTSASSCFFFFCQPTVVCLCSLSCLHCLCTVRPTVLVKNSIRNASLKTLNILSLKMLLFYID